MSSQVPGPSLDRGAAAPGRLGEPVRTFTPRTRRLLGWPPRLRLRGRPGDVHLFTGGLVVDGPDGEAGYGWDDLASVTVSGVRPAACDRTRWTFTVVARDGRELRFGDELEDVRVLGEAVAAEVTRRMVPRRLEAVRAGGSVRFGPFTVDLHGIEKEGERVAWSAVRAVGIENGLVTVHLRGGVPGPAATAGGTPDAVAFAEVCRRIAAFEV